MQYLDHEEILAIHYGQIEQWGGSHGIRDLNGLLSAIDQPKASFGGEKLYPAIFDKAAVLMRSIILNHPFIDGNKRTALVAAARFLFANGHIFEALPDDAYQKCIETAESNVENDELASWLKENSRPL